MPNAPHRECNHPLCPNYAARGGYCVEHQHVVHKRTAGAPGQNLTPSNRRFRRLRRAFLMRHPMCNVCQIEPARELDHVRPHRGNARLFWDQANWQGLCKLCHCRKSYRELLLAREVA